MHTLTILLLCYVGFAALCLLPILLEALVRIIPLAIAFAIALLLVRGC